MSAIHGGIVEQTTINNGDGSSTQINTFGDGSSTVTHIDNKTGEDLGNGNSTFAGSNITHGDLVNENDPDGNKKKNHIKH
ncbi:hypothetical protein [Vibrio sinaloensis]|uniref:hypothetical protein n=1 Tax=Photobacterium sp. (strain ATCC 43367) TaxID=379097 RepID=UPI0022B07E15|nr:hypothetical protein [Vibrio sinaloensis]MCZ4293922.1 hypothetical protein [Vibrio sinaloensis]